MCKGPEAGHLLVCLGNRKKDFFPSVSFMVIYPGLSAVPGTK